MRITMGLFEAAEWGSGQASASQPPPLSMTTNKRSTASKAQREQHGPL
jgi:hypothetical protein